MRVLTRPFPAATRLTGTAGALTEAIAQQMALDDSVICLGEDVAGYGGVHGTTRGLLERFGPDRVLDTPVSAAAFVGLATGAATLGLRPIAQLASVDVVGVCLDQVYNHMAKIHFESGGAVAVPVVLAAPVGGGHGGAAAGSQCLWATFAHLPGMKVVVPSGPYDAKGLMISAIRDDDPVVYLVHRTLTDRPWPGDADPVVEQVPEQPYEVPIGRARVVREGGDVTIVAVALSVRHAVEVAELLAAEDGVQAEVIDLRGLVPLDRPAVLASVAKTGRLVIVDEDYLSYGMSGEIVATITDEDPGMLRAPVARVAVPDVAVPYAQPLERAVLPGPDRIRAAVARVCRA